MKFARVLLLALVATGPLTTVVLATPASSASVDRDDAPFAEAGLDQESTVGDRVLLDGGGSRAASSDIVEYEWTITGPNGSTVRPSCATCVRTAFVPNRPGRHAVTLTVTDADGRTNSDTMYVEADAAAIPGVSISGPRRIASDRPAEFTATFRPGDVELSHVVWTIDGSPVENATINRNRNASLERTFSSPGTVRVNATVHDRIGRERTATRRVVVASPSSPSPSAPTPSLSVQGPQLLTGDAPFEGTYGLDGADVDDVESVSWHDDDGSRGSGVTLDTEWEAGTHELTALADVGDDTYSASFENGTSVVVDPRPEVSLTMSQTDGTLSGSVDATDEFGNLDSVELFVDDERVREWAPANGEVFDTSFSVDLDSGQNSNRVRVVVTDRRGQSAADTNRAGEPDLVRSGFVNGPVDSYHERLDPERYTAIHKTVIDLNGVDPGAVSPELVPSGDDPELQKIKADERKYDTKTDVLTITSYWAGKAPEEYKIYMKSDVLGDSRGEFRVTNSDPEPRIEVIDEGEDSENKGYRLLIDVSDSFDPDGGPLNFRAQDRDRRPDDPDLIGLEFSDTPGLVITDGDGNSVDLSSELYDYWSPEFKKVEEVSEGPYKPDDTIRFKVKTETFHLADRDYDPSLELRVKGGEGEVTEWRPVSHDADAGPDPNLHEIRHPQYVGTVEVDARSYLNPEAPFLVIANVKQTSWERLPSVDVFEEDRLERNNASISSIEYTQKEIIERTVTSQAERYRHEAKGYRVEDSSKTLETITIEKRRSKPPEVVDTRTFSSKTMRKLFLSTHPNWSPSGTTVETREIEINRWLGAPRSAGRYTGEKRVKRICSGSGAFMRAGRCVPIESTETVTQYLHIFHGEKDKTMYLAEKSETRTYWEPIGAVTTPQEASIWTEQSGIRVGSQTYSKEWKMVKRTGSTIVSDSYSDASDVVRTSATVEYDRQYSLRGGANVYDKSTPHEKTVTVDQISGTISFEGFKSKREIIKSVESGARISKSSCSIDGSIGC
ncbi:PKD domain-containing protein [Natronoarchaeum rubrum]|uniref:PKD domain-containing protein n=1 Tax=Natronoarchaeum rubrum TaxID=755311 RepID=UPI002113349C|nr:PKD domain-containing protein [Natronoarchaeum rubrum]